MLAKVLGVKIHIYQKIKQDRIRRLHSFGDKGPDHLVILNDNHYTAFKLNHIINKVEVNQIE